MALDNAEVLELSNQITVDKVKWIPDSSVKPWIGSSSTLASKTCIVSSCVPAGEISISQLNSLLSCKRINMEDSPYLIACLMPWMPKFTVYEYIKNLFKEILKRSMETVKNLKWIHKKISTWSKIHVKNLRPKCMTLKFSH